MSKSETKVGRECLRTAQQVMQGHGTASVELDHNGRHAMVILKFLDETLVRVPFSARAKDINAAVGLMRQNVQRRIRDKASRE